MRQKALEGSFEIECLNCGYVGRADIVGAINIANGNLWSHAEKALSESTIIFIKKNEVRRCDYADYFYGGRGQKGCKGIRCR